jgi:hypothetical protein
VVVSGSVPIDIPVKGLGRSRGGGVPGAWICPTGDTILKPISSTFLPIKSILLRHHCATWLTYAFHNLARCSSLASSGLLLYSRQAIEHRVRAALYKSLPAGNGCLLIKGRVDSWSLSMIISVSDAEVVLVEESR